jgi:hypothetical protein
VDRIICFTGGFRVQRDVNLYMGDSMYDSEDLGSAIEASEGAMTVLRCNRVRRRGWTYPIRLCL